MIELKQKLMKADQGKLIKFILSFYETGDKTFKSQLDIFMASLDNDVNKTKTLIKKELKLLLKRDFVDYYEAKGYGETIDALRCRIMEELKDQSIELALEMMEEIYENQEELLESVDDSNGFVGTVLTSLGKDYAILLKEMNFSLEEKVNRIFEKICDDQYGIYDELITQTKDILEKEGLMLLWERIISLYSPEKERDYFSISSLKKIADVLEDVELFVKAVNLGSFCDFDRLQIAKRLLEKDRPQDALDYISSCEEDKSNHYFDDERPHYWTLLIQCLQALGQFEKAQEARLNWFDRYLNARIYHDILKHASDDFASSFRQKAIQKAFEEKNVIQGLSFLRDIKAIQEIAKFVFLKRQFLEGSYYRVLVPVAESLEGDYPLEATLLYRIILEWVLEGTKAKYYHHAAKYLRACTALSADIIDWKGITPEISYHQSIRVKHVRKRKFWEEYNQLEGS